MNRGLSPCIDCGGPRELGRRRCLECQRARSRILSKKRHSLFGRYHYGKIHCKGCGKIIKKYRKDQRYCSKCYCALMTKARSATNSYTNAGGEGYCWMHRRIAESIFGRKLSSDEVVHHLDEDPRNNDLENLVVMSRSMHAKLHCFLDRSLLLQKESGNFSVSSWSSVRRNITKSWLSTVCDNFIILSSKGACWKGIQRSLKRI